MTNTYVIFTESGKEHYLAELLTNTVVKNNPESARRIYVPTKAILTKSAQTGQKWIEEKTILFPNYVFVESSEIEIFSTHLHAPSFDTSYYLLGKGSSRMPKGKHIYFIAETKGTMESMHYRRIEDAKIDCAKKLFNTLSTSRVKYHNVDSYQNLLAVMNSL